MQLENSEQIRNLAVVGHNDTGKTTLLAGLLYAGGVFNRQNRVEDGNTVTDFDDEEVRRGISIGLAVCYTPWSAGGASYKVNLIDCPGSGIFVHESSSGMRAADAALLCVNAASPTQVMAEKAWEIAGEMEQPVMFHLTKMDRDNI
ncbi:MAG: GTP-binding protein, partial [bacterium]|nr:GTP-binding protein [bacterium]